MFSRLHQSDFPFVAYMREIQECFLFWSLRATIWSIRGFWYHNLRRGQASVVEWSAASTRGLVMDLSLARKPASGPQLR